jgi:hypothetical protein
MSLLGDRAWWLPRWLDRILPSVNLEATTPAPTIGTAHTHPGRAASSPTGTGSGTVASGPQVPPAGSRVEPLPVQTAIRNAQAINLGHRRWRSGPVVEDAGVSDRQVQQCR